MSLLMKMVKLTRARLYLLFLNNQYNSTTGNWKLFSTGVSTAAITSTGANFSNGGAQEQAGMQTTNQINLTGKNLLHIEGVVTSQFNAGTNPLRMGIGTTAMLLSNCWQDIYVRKTTFAGTGAFHATVDVSGLSGSYYVGFGCVAVVNVSQVWLE